MYRVGSLVSTNAKLYTIKNLCWKNEDIFTLETYLPCDGSASESDFTNVILKVNKTCTNWYNRSMSLSGKVIIVNALIGSLFVYKMNNMLNLSEDQIQQVNDKIYHFLQNGRRARISRNTLIRKCEQGGLELVCIEKKQIALKVQWVFKVMNDEFIKMCIFKSLDPHLSVDLWQCNVSHRDVKLLFNLDTFWVQVLHAWSHINYHEPQSVCEVANQYIWYNSHIRISGKPVMYKTWYDAGIILVGDLFTSGYSMNYEDFVRKFPNLLWLDYQGLITSLPTSWKIWMRDCGEDTFDGHLFDRWLEKPKVSKLAYDILIDDERCLFEYCQKWHKLGYAIPYNEYCHLFKVIYKYTNTVKYRDFMYRLLLCKIVTDKDLCDWNIDGDGKCK